MYNWSTDTTRLKKNKEKFIIWKLEQSINYGLRKNKLSSKEIKKYLNRLNIDTYKKSFLNLILYGKKPTFS